MDGIMGCDLDEIASLAKRMMSHAVHDENDCIAHDELRAAVQARLFRHVFPPTALGTRRSSLSMKLHACAHAMRLENANWRAVQRMSECFCTLTCDMGTEMDLNRVEGIDVASAFDYWARLNFGGDNDGEAENAGDDVGSRIGFSGSLYIPGALQ